MSVEQISCLLIGEGPLLVQCGDILLSRGHRIHAVVSASPLVQSWAHRQGVRLLERGADTERKLEEEKFDWLFSIANLKMLPKGVWGRAHKGTANFHDGPLPLFAGLNAPAWAIMTGAESHGVVWHEITERADEGDILVSAEVEISDMETSLSLNTKCFAAGIETFEQLIQDIDNGSLEPTAQDLKKRTYYSRHARPASGAILDFSKPADELLRLSRALDFGQSYDNPLGLPRLLTEGGVLNIGSVAPVTAAGGSVSGEILEVTNDGIIVACHTAALRLSALTDSRGTTVAPQAVGDVGHKLPRLSNDDIDVLDRTTAELAKHEAKFAERLADFEDIALTNLQPEASDSAIAEAALELPGKTTKPRLLGALFAALGRLSGQDNIGVALETDLSIQLACRWPGLFSADVPFSIAIDDNDTVANLSSAVEGQLSQLETMGSYAGDLISRTSHIPEKVFTVAVRNSARFEGREHGAAIVPRSALTIILDFENHDHRILVDTSRFEGNYAVDLQQRLVKTARHAIEHPDTVMSDLPLVDEQEFQSLVYEQNSTVRDYDRFAMVHTLIEQQVLRTPDAIALASGDMQLTYRELNAKANQFAHALAEAGAGPDVPVGIYKSRDADLLVAALGCLKAGSAYVPLDPTYPEARLAHMIADSGLRIIVSDVGKTPPIEDASSITVLDVSSASSGRPSAAPPVNDVRPEHLAYVIYTSGSTGRPKGVLVEHRNVVNFFAGMDDRVTYSRSEQPVWLAVTSLSFDISVLELFWTLANGFKVVLYRGGKGDEETAVPQFSSDKGMDFGLFYWGDDAAPGGEKYKLLLDGARFADNHGFKSIWTPERHFHAFGGPYPNPAVTGAAVAAITKNVEIRAGSCVLPLHHPARVAEDWSIIDNLSNGRAGIAFASGWMPEDFILRPENAPPNNKVALLRDIPIVQKLWRGDAVKFDGADGTSLEVVTLPRPVQDELPTWVTTAGNPESFRQTAGLGANLLTHLLGQSMSELEQKIRIYREALSEAGRDPSAYKVTLMLHTLIGTDREVVKQRAREPMKQYLRSAAALIKQYAWAFPTFKKPEGVENAADIDLQSLHEDDLDAIVEFAFERYFNDSGLFGTVEDAIQRVEQLKAIGVDEIACLIDFSVPLEQVQEGWLPLAEVVEACAMREEAEHLSAVVPRAGLPESIASLVEQYGVTHLQCTPSMANLLLLDPDDARSLSVLQQLYLGGEALPGSFLRRLRASTSVPIENMYGPTETTIWSSTGAAYDTDKNVPLGTPIANTQLYVLDKSLKPVPLGYPGELFIGGDGVTRGYHRRPELTAERFLENPFVPGSRMYMTGDLVRYEPDGQLLFLGRTDHQVKIRGFRIELAEIETKLASYDGIEQAVVVAVGSADGAQELVAYCKPAAGFKLITQSVAAHLGDALPEYMVPSRFLVVDDFPLTPNKKIDRNRLPDPAEIYKQRSSGETKAPKNEMEAKIKSIWETILETPNISTSDNFFEIGGHSLRAVQVQRQLRELLQRQFPITDIFRFPTIEGLAQHFSTGPDRSASDQAIARGQRRKGALRRRRK